MPSLQCTATNKPMTGGCSLRSKEGEALEGVSEFGSPGVRGLTLILISSSAIAWEMPTPSCGDVALPNSSIRTNDSEEARPRIIAEVAISLENVLRLFSMSSSFDRRVRRWAWMLRSGYQSSCKQEFKLGKRLTENSRTLPGQNNHTGP